MAFYHSSDRFTEGLSAISITLILIKPATSQSLLYFLTKQASSADVDQYQAVGESETGQKLIVDQ